MFQLLRRRENRLLASAQLQPEISNLQLTAVGLCFLLSNQLLEQTFIQCIQSLPFRPALQLLLVTLHAGLGQLALRLVLKWDLDVFNLNGSEKRLEAVKVLRRDRIIFVVVTAGAAHGQTEEHGSGCGCDFVEVGLPDFFGHQIRAVPGRQPQESQGNVSLDIGWIVVAGLAVLVTSSQLLDDELVVRHVRGEGFNDPVAIAPGVSDRSVALEPTGFTVADQVKPMTSPPLTVARVG